MFQNKKNYTITAILFFFSGFAALSYQIIWTRLLLLTFGNTTYSVVAVLAAFMAGLAFGSYLFGRFSNTFKYPLKVFGLIELGVGVMAILTPFLFNLLNSTYLLFAQEAIKSSDFILVKFIATALVILPATTLMGGTLPTVLNAFSRLSKSVSSLTGKLYAVNILGSIFGALFTAFIAIELFGLSSTIYLCSLLNLFIFFVTRFIPQTPIQTRKIRVKINSSGGTDYLRRNTAIIVYGLSGITSMALEVLWIRLLTPSVGTYTYAFSAILVIFLAGLTLGSYYYEKYLDNISETFTILGYAELIIALSAFFSVIVVSSGLIPANPILQTIFVVFPGTFAMGTILPTITRLSSQSEIGSFVGKAVFFNSIGSTIGPILAGFVLIPQLGSSKSVLIIAIFTACFATLLFLLREVKGKIRYRKTLPIFSFTFALLLIVIIITGQDRLLTQRFIKHQQAIHKNLQQVFYEDEVATVFAYSSSDYQNHGLIIDGVETTRLVPETKLIAHLPLLIHPNPQNVLIIALGMGTTFRSSLTHPIKSVDVVELVPSVVKTLPLFHPDTSAILADLRGNIIINDGRQFVHMTSKKYDVVTIDPPPPVNSAGTTVLYSREFYRDIKKHLRSKGVVQQWFFFDTTTQTSELKMLIKTFLDEFSYALVFRSPHNLGISVVASDTPLSFSQETITEKLKQTKITQDLKEWPDTPSTFSEFKNLYLGDKKIGQIFTQNFQIVTENNPRTEFFLLRRLFKPSLWIHPEELIQELENITDNNTEN